MRDLDGKGSIEFGPFLERVTGGDLRCRKGVGRNDLMVR